MKDFKKAGRFGGGGGFKKRSYGGGGEGRPEMHQATCASCGKICEVPFRPNGEKPVYCRDCFNNPDREFAPPKNFDRGNSFREKPSYRPEPRERSGGSDNAELANIAKKLDKIISLLEEGKNK